MAVRTLTQPPPPRDPTRNHAGRLSPPRRARILGKASRSSRTPPRTLREDRRQAEWKEVRREGRRDELAQDQGREDRCGRNQQRRVLPAVRNKLSGGSQMPGWGSSSVDERR